MQKTGVAGYFTSDLHWSERPPAARVAEADWLAVQHKAFARLLKAAKADKAPVFIAGDLFNRWDSPAAIVNAVIAWCYEHRDVTIYAIPGNHDTPYHDYKQLHRSSYWTLVEAEVVRHVGPRETVEVGNLQVTAFPWGFDLEGPPTASSMSHPVALIHGYVWSPKQRTGYKGASQETMAGPWAERLDGYELAFFGDNHRNFHSKVGGKNLYNCGTVLRRHSDEKDYTPAAWKLATDGTAERFFFDTGADKFIDMAEAAAKTWVDFEGGLADFAMELAQSSEERLDFAKAVIQWIETNNVPKHVKELMLRAMRIRDYGKR